MLKPAGRFNFVSGSLSADAASGGGATGAILATASLSGRPWAQVGGVVVGGAVGWIGGALVCAGCATSGDGATANVPSAPANNSTHVREKRIAIASDRKSTRLNSSYIPL